MMNPQVTAALISAVVALVVALLGIAGAVASQGVATRRAYRNSLALFEAQHAAETESRRREREEAERQEDARRFADERRVTYAKFLRLAAELVAAEKDSSYYRFYALGNYVESMRWEGREPSPADLQARAVECKTLERKYFRQYVDLRFELDEVVAEIDLLGSGPVREAARILAKSAAALQGRPSHKALPVPPGLEPGYDDLRIAFLARARHELGVETGRQHAVSRS